MSSKCKQNFPLLQRLKSHFKRKTSGESRASAALRAFIITIILYYIVVGSAPARARTETSLWIT